MDTSDDDLRVLASVASEVEASLIVATLENHGVQATATGGFTSAFKAEAPGDVRVLVKRRDWQRARQALQSVRAGSGAEAEAGEGEPETDAASAGEISPELRRAWRAAVIGGIFLPPLPNLYSLGLLLHYRLSAPRRGPSDWRFPMALAVNLLVIVLSALLYAALWFGL